MSLIFQGVRDIGSSLRLSLSPRVNPADTPSLIKNINSLECTVHSLTLNASCGNKQIQGDTATSCLHQRRYEQMANNITKKKVWSKNDYSQVDKYISSVTESSSFLSGLECNKQKINAFQESTKKGYLSAFSYIVNNTNPNYYLGIFRNLLRFFSTGALHQNCVFCSKAVDKNLAELANGKVNTFWFAKQTGRGGLPQNIAEKNYQYFVMQSSSSLSSQLLASTRESSRNIIIVPVKNRHFSHAMNLVRTEMADIVLDGQSGRVYDLSSAQGRARFDERYGYSSALNIVQIYDTGQAPGLERISPVRRAGA